MYHLSAADVNGNMVDGTVLAIEEQITRLRRRCLDPCAAVGLGLGGMGQADAVFLIYTQYKAGAVAPLVRLVPPQTYGLPINCLA